MQLQLNFPFPPTACILLKKFGLSTLKYSSISGFSVLSNASQSPSNEESRIDLLNTTLDGLGALLSQNKVSYFGSTTLLSAFLILGFDGLQKE